MNFDKGDAETEDKTGETVIQKIFDELPVPRVMSEKLLQQLFKKVYGKPSWLVRRRFGPSILLEFGKPKLQVSKNVFPPTKKGRKFPKRMLKVYGHWHLTTFCSDWEIRQSENLHFPLEG